ncbi:MAG: acyl-CoA carboxylase subunit beta [Lachnospiraceae bacterium]
MGTTTQASQRIINLLDDNSFVEIGALVTARATDFNLSQTETPGDGVITGYGVINGHLVYVYSQDSSVLGGSIGEMHAKKIVKIYELALKTGAPVIGLIDSAGLRLQEATDALNGFGELYLKQTIASGVIPQITAVFGSCGGGLAIIPTLTDFTFMEEQSAHLFINSPNALNGNEIAKCDTSSASFQELTTGIVDVVGKEEEILEQIRELITILPSSNEDDDSYTECMDNLNRTCNGLEDNYKDIRLAMSQISDDQFFYEIKPNFAKAMVTGFIKLNGVTVGAIGNRTALLEDGEVIETFEPVLTVKGCEKAADFVRFCDAFEIPLLTFTNVKGFEASMCAEKNIAKQVAKLTYAFASATVPKVNVIVELAMGSAYIAMNSKSIGADMTFAWPNATIGTMDATLAAKIMCNGQGFDKIESFSKEYEALQNNVESAARRGYIDTIINPCDTRKYVIGAFEMLFTKRVEQPAKKHGTV